MCIRDSGYRDKVSLSGFPFVYHEFLGKAQRGHDNVVLPFAWNDRDKILYVMMRSILRERIIEMRCV